MLLAASCVREAGDPAVPDALRLIDVLADGDLERPFDPADRAALLEHGTVLLVREQPGPGAGDRTGAFERSGGRAALGARLGAGKLVTDGDGRVLLPPFSRLVHWLELTDESPLELTLPISGGLTLAAVLELDRLPQAAELDDAPALAERLLAEGLVLGRADGDDAELLATRLAPHPGRRALLIGVQVDDQPVAVGALEVRRVGALAHQLRSGVLSPSGHHLRVGREAQECLLLPPGSRAQWTLNVPLREPTLFCGLARVGAELPLTARWRVEPDAGEALAFEWEATDDSWEAQRLELDALAGRRVRLTLEVASPRAEPGSVALAVGAPRLIGRPAAPPAHAADVIVVSLDTLRADRVVPGFPTSPRLQQLMADAVVFREALSTSSWTLPAHSSLFTGRWAQGHGATRQDRRLADMGDRRLARVFRDGGYETVAITGGGYVSPAYGLAEGFERYSIDDPALPPPGERWRRRSDGRERLVELLGAERRRPLFLFVHTFSVHNGKPFPEELAQVGLSPDDPQRLRAELFSRTRADETFDPDPAFEADVASVYDASVLSGDELVGEIVDTLAAAGRLEQTVLVVTSDHGQELFDHRGFGHGHQLHHELVNVPLLVRAPGMAPAVVDDPVSIVDLAPTLRELAGLPADPGAHGRSLVPALRGEPLPPVPLLAHLARLQEADRHLLRRGPAVLLAREEPDGSLAVEGLYDLRSDPHEQVPLSAELGDEAARMLDELEQRLAPLRRDPDSQGAPMLLDAETRRQLVELGYLAGT